jgi:MHS family proline/betaine transporter-like MFS transporter
VGVTLFGGLSPLVMMWLTDATGDSMAPAYYLMTLAVLSLASVLAARRWYAVG